MYLLDTNICIELLKGNRTVRAHVEKAGPRNCCISEITVAELYYGAYKGERSFEKKQDIRFLLELFDLLPIAPSLAVYGEIKTAGHCLVTNNTKHLSRIPGLKLEDWR